MTIDEAKKMGFRFDKDEHPTTWRIDNIYGIPHIWKGRATSAKILGIYDFPTRAKAREELKRLKAGESVKLAEAHTAARKADGTQVPADPEPPKWEERKEGLVQVGDESTGGFHDIQSDDSRCSSGWVHSWVKVYKGSGLEGLVIGTVNERPVYKTVVRARYESPAHVAWRKRHESKEETPEQRDARLKATYEGYCKAGGLITKEHLTEEMVRWCVDHGITWWNFETTSTVDHRGGFYATAEWIIQKRAFWNKADAAHDLWLADRREHQMEPITEEQRKMLHDDDIVYWPDKLGSIQWGHWCISKQWYGDCPFGFSAKAVQAALDKAKQPKHSKWIERSSGTIQFGDDVTINETVPLAEECIPNNHISLGWVPYGPGEHSYVEGHTVGAPYGSSDKILRARYLSPECKSSPEEVKGETVPEHKFADIPSWCPPLPDGCVPLGFGDTFNKPQVGFRGVCSSKFRPAWDFCVWNGGNTSFFYAAPRYSEVAILNYPWLKDEVASHKTPSSETHDDPVNHPTHYTSSLSGIECIQVTEWMGFLLGNAVKYIWRAGSKGNEKQDLQKAVWYIQRRISQIEKEAK